MACNESTAAGLEPLLQRLQINARAGLILKFCRHQKIWCCVPRRIHDGGFGFEF